MILLEKCIENQKEWDCQWSGIKTKFNERIAVICIIVKHINT